MTPAELLHPTYRQMLGALDAWLAKAALRTGPGGADALMGARLAPDMFPLATQIRFCCVQALEGACRLRGATFPSLHATLLDEGRQSADAPGLLAHARGRIAETLAALDGAGGSRPERPETEALAHALPQGMVFDLTVGTYARDWAVPQFFFHLCMAYAILRAEGVELGKADYVAHMFAHLRRDPTSPAAA